MVAYYELIEQVTAPSPRQIGKNNGWQRTDYGKVIYYREQGMSVVGVENIYQKKVRHKTNMQRQILREPPFADCDTPRVMYQHIDEKYGCHTAANYIEMPEFYQLFAENYQYGV